VEMKKLSILGSTGSIGTQTLDIVKNNTDEFKVIGLTTNKNIELLENQINEFKPEAVAVTNEYISVKEYVDPATQVVFREIVSEDLPYNFERPEIAASTSYIWISAAVIIGTLLLLLIIKFRKVNLWKLWFFFAVFFHNVYCFCAIYRAIFSCDFGVCVGIDQNIQANYYIK